MVHTKIKPGIVTPGTGVTIELSDALDPSLINSVAVMMGSELSNVRMKELITEDFVVKCKAELVHSRKKRQEVKFADKHCARMFLDFFIYLAQCKVHEVYPYLRQALFWRTFFCESNVCFSDTILLGFGDFLPFLVKCHIRSQISHMCVL